MTLFSTTPLGVRKILLTAVSSLFCTFCVTTTSLAQTPPVAAGTPAALPPPLALPPLPSDFHSAFPGESTPAAASRSATRTRQGAPEVNYAAPSAPPPDCPSREMSAKNLLQFGDRSQADLCVDGKLRPQVIVGDEVGAYKVGRIDSNGVLLEPKSGRGKSRLLTVTDRFSN